MPAFQPVAFKRLKKEISKLKRELNRTGSPSGGGGIPDAPSDGTTYGRNNGAWTAVSLTGVGAGDNITWTGTHVFNNDVTATSSFTVNPTAANGNITADVDAGYKATLAFKVGGNLRWQFQTDGTTESGSDAGSDLVLKAVDDAGTGVISESLKVTRSTGVINFASAPEVGGNTMYSYFPIWAEESGAITVGNIWSFGNGDLTPAAEGIPIGVACELISVGGAMEGGTGIVIDALKNGTSVASSAAITGSAVTTVTPVSYAVGDIFNFETSAMTTGGTSGRVVAWFRVPF